MSWEIPKTTFQMLSSWKGVGRREAEQDWWQCIPACIWWTVRKGKNSRYFEDRSSHMQKIKMKCCSFFYFWCKQDLMEDINDFSRSQRENAKSLSFQFLVLNSWTPNVRKPPSPSLVMGFCDT